MIDAIRHKEKTKKALAGEYGVHRNTISNLWMRFESDPAPWQPYLKDKAPGANDTQGQDTTCRTKDTTGG